MARETTTETPAVAMSAEQFAALLNTVKDSAAAGQMDRLEQILLRTAEVSAQTMKRALKPENDHHPGVSAFSYPEGDFAKPRPTLDHEVYWNGYPVHQFPETWHWLELELLSQIVPGEYFVSKANDEGTQPISAKGEYDADGKLTKLTVIAQCSRDEQRTAPPATVWLYQMLHKATPRSQSYIEGMNLFMQHIVMGKPPTDAVPA